MGTGNQIAATDRDLAELKAVFKTLKRILRERRMPYAELGRRIGLSESGVKKVFSGKDVSFSRLAQIAAVLGFRIADLLEQVESNDTKRVQFSKEQQSYFLKNRRAFHLYIKLAIERQSRDDVKTEFGLSERETFSLLKKLDELRLIQLHASSRAVASSTADASIGGRVKLPPLAMVKDFGDGPLMSALYQEWGSGIVKDLAEPKHQASGRFIVRALRLKEESYNELLARLLELEREFLKRAVREMSVSTRRLKTVRWMWLTDDQSYIRGSL